MASGATADYRITARQPLGLLGTTLAVERSGARIEAQSPLLGDAGALAVAASLAVAEWILSRPLEQAELEAALADLVAGGEGRLSPVTLADGTLVIDDSYNANPASMRSSVLTAAELARHDGRRLILVLGEMRELGGVSASEHEALGRLVAQQERDERFRDWRRRGTDCRCGDEPRQERHVRGYAPSKPSTRFVAPSSDRRSRFWSRARAASATEKVVAALVEQRGRSKEGGRA